MNSKRGLAKVQIGDGTKYLKFTTNALVELEDVLGCSVTSLFMGDETQIGERLGFKTVRALLWAGLKGAGSKFSIRAVGEIMEPQELQTYLEAIGKALNSALGSTTSIEEDPEADKLRPTEDPQPEADL